MGNQMLFDMSVIDVCAYFGCPMDRFVSAPIVMFSTRDIFTSQVGKCQAIIGDGLSMGRTCCGVFRCPEPLQNNRHRFCAEHNRLHDVCAIVGCENPVLQTTVNDPKGGPPKVIKKKTCLLPVHQQIEKKHGERSTGSFLYKERLQHAQISQPVDPFSHSRLVPEEDVQEDFESYTMRNALAAGSSGVTVTFSLQKNPGSVGVMDQDSETASLPGPPVPCPSKSPAGNQPTFKALFGRRRTHNEQTLVRPCGVIFARATMFGAEAVSNFLVMVKNAFSVPGAHKPEHIFYDTNCLARQQAEKDPWFKGIGMCVDAWHFRNKHATSHAYCQLNCNPAMYPELMDDFSAWFFNTSIAEQTNAWLGGYHSMCREMLPAKFDFFLDEMIRLRNIEVINRLERQGHHPINL
jgi:CxC6 like cysteine cluster associated with KDZ transposases